MSWHRELQQLQMTANCATPLQFPSPILHLELHEWLGRESHLHFLPMEQSGQIDSTLGTLTFDGPGRKPRECYAAFQHVAFLARRGRTIFQPPRLHYNEVILSTHTHMCERTGKSVCQLPEEVMPSHKMR